MTCNFQFEYINVHVDVQNRKNITNNMNDNEITK